MTVTVSVPSVLRSECGGATELSLSVDTVRAALERLEQDFPNLHRRICDETGEIRQHVNLFVNDVFLHECNGVDTPLSSGDVLTIMPAVSGG